MIGKLLVASACLLFTAANGLAAAEEDPSIGRMRVALWPEYDDPGVLVIYDGRFTDSSRFPLKTSFFLPKGALISDACSLSPKGQHFCQLYKTRNRGEFDEVTLYLPFPNFYLSFHTPPLDTGSEKRHISYRVRTNHEIETLEFDIQEPLRSAQFTIVPAGGDVSHAKGFNHYRYIFDDVPKGENKAFEIAYAKKDRLPSVDIKYSRMSGDRVWGSPYDTQRKAKNIVYIVLATGIMGLAGMLTWLFFSRRRKNSSDA